MAAYLPVSHSSRLARHAAKVVWLSIHFPMSPRSGGELASASMLASLAAAGMEVFSIHIRRSAPAAPVIESFRGKFGLSGVSVLTTARESFVERCLFGLFLAALVPFLPFPYSRLMRPKVRRKYKEILSQITESAPQGPILVVCDGLQPCALLRAAGLETGTRYIYRAHNVESDLWRSSGRLRGPLLRCLNAYQAWRVARLERWVLRRFDQIHAISADDAAALRELGAEPDDVYFTPVAMNGPYTESTLPRARREVRAARGGDGMRLLFLGYLAWPPNRAGLTWFLDRVWKRLLAARPSVSLTVAGVGGDDLAGRYGEWPKVGFTGYLSDDQLRNALLSHDLLIVPIFSGAGVRIKVVQAALHGLACIGTDLGMRGSTLEADKQYLSVDREPETWIERLAAARASDCETLGRSAFERVFGTFTRAAVDKAFQERLWNALER